MLSISYDEVSVFARENYLTSAVRAATENPARAIGVFETRGSLDPGKIADIVLLDADLRVRRQIWKETEVCGMVKFIANQMNRLPGGNSVLRADFG